MRDMLAAPDQFDCRHQIGKIAREAAQRPPSSAAVGGALAAAGGGDDHRLRRQKEAEGRDDVPGDAPQRYLELFDRAGGPAGVGEDRSGSPPSLIWWA